MAGQFNIPGWDPTTMTYMQPTRSVASITQGASPEVLQTVKDIMSRTPSAMVQQTTVTPEKAQILDQIFNRPKNIFLDTKPSVTSKELSSAIREAGGVRPKTLNQRLTTLEKELGNFYKKGMPTLAKPSKKAVATGLKAGRVAGRIATPLAILADIGTFAGNNPIDEKVAAGLSLLGGAGMAVGRSPYISIPSAILATGAGTYPLWKDKIQNKLNEFETNKQLAKASKEDVQPADTVAIEEIITEPVPNVGQWDGTRTDSITNFVNGLTSDSNVQPNAVNQNVSAPEATQQQFVYETPEARQDYINRIEEFAANYPAMVEQDRRRRMQAALLAPVIGNDRFVDEAIGQSPIDTTAKQLELLNTAANARVSEAQRPLLAKAFAEAGMPAELAYASDDQLKSLVNLLVAQTNMKSGMYKAGMDAATRRYVADMRNKGLNAELSLKYGPQGMMSKAIQSMLTPEEYANWLKYMDKAAPAINRIQNSAPVVTNWGNADYTVPGERDYFPPNLKE